MKKSYKIEVDCANCANKMEEAAKNTAGVKDATVNFMMLKKHVRQMSPSWDESMDHYMNDSYGKVFGNGL